MQNDIRSLQNYNHTLQEELKESKEAERDAEIKMTEMNKLEAVLRTRLSSYEKTISELEKSEELLRLRLSESQQQEYCTQGKLMELTKEDHAARVKVLESQNQDLMKVIRAMQNSTEPIRSPSPTEKSKVNFLRARSLSPSRELDNRKSYIFEAENASHHDLVLKLHEMQRMEEYHHTKIRALNKHLETFRQAVEHATVTIETDTHAPKKNIVTVKVYL